MKKALTVLIVAACVCVEWTRFKGTVKAVNLKSGTVTIENSDDALVTIPVDYEVKIVEKHGELRQLKDLQLDDKVTLIRTPADVPIDQPDENLVPLEKKR